MVKTSSIRQGIYIFLIVALFLFSFSVYNIFQVKPSQDVQEEQDLIYGDLYYNLDNPDEVYFKEDGTTKFIEVELNG